MTQSVLQVYISNYMSQVTTGVVDVRLSGEIVTVRVSGRCAEMQPLLEQVVDDLIDGMRLEFNLPFEPSSMTCETITTLAPSPPPPSPMPPPPPPSPSPPPPIPPSPSPSPPVPLPLPAYPCECKDKHPTNGNCVICVKVGNDPCKRYVGNRNGYPPIHCNRFKQDRHQTQCTNKRIGRFYLCNWIG